MQQLCTYLICHLSSDCPCFTTAAAATKPLFEMGAFCLFQPYDLCKFQIPVWALGYLYVFQISIAHARTYDVFGSANLVRFPIPTLSGSAECVWFAYYAFCSSDFRCAVLQSRNQLSGR